MVIRKNRLTPFQERVMKNTVAPIMGLLGRAPPTRNTTIKSRTEVRKTIRAIERLQQINAEKPLYPGDPAAFARQLEEDRKNLEEARYVLKNRQKGKRNGKTAKP